MPSKSNFRLHIEAALRISGLRQLTRVSDYPVKIGRNKSSTLYKIANARLSDENLLQLLEKVSEQYPRKKVLVKNTILDEVNVLTIKVYGVTKEDE